MRSTAGSCWSRGCLLGRAVALGGLCLLGLAGQEPSTPKPLVEVTAIRFWSLGEVTRIAVVTSGEAAFFRDRIHNPERIFFDLKGARSKLGNKGSQTIPVGDRLVKQIRIAQTQPRVARIVLDLESDAEFTASQLANPYRLIIELRPVAGAKAAAGPVPAVETAKPPAAAETPAGTSAPPQAGGPVRPPAAPAATAVPAKTTSRGERSLTRALGLKVGRVVIDAGHGGHDHGTTGPTGLTEKELVLDLAQRLGALIEERLGSEVVYTRTDDTFVPLETRTEIANNAQADLFLSIHANSSPYKGVSGAETFYLNFTTSKADLEVAARENATSQKSIHELTELLQKIAKKDKAEESREFAAKVQSALYVATPRQAARPRNRGVKKAPFVVLIGASMPSVLVEVGFLSNPRDEGLFKKPEYRQRLAEALYKGLSQYAGTLSHFQVAQTRAP
jgi:N-acetylmuramoyl-L-alanine amidase